MAVRISFAIILPILLLGFQTNSNVFSFQEGVRKCADFEYQEDAQEYFVSKGGSRYYNTDFLDNDRDGIACERLPSRAADGSTASSGLLLLGLLIIGLVGVTIYLVRSQNDPRQGIGDISNQIRTLMNHQAFSGGLSGIRGIVTSTFAKMSSSQPATPSFPLTPSQLRWMRYDDYLQTDHWKAVRKDALHRADHKCQLCGTRTIRLDVHHNDYQYRGQERPHDVLVLCRRCHARFHEGGNMPVKGFAARRCLFRR